MRCILAALRAGFFLCEGGAGVKGKNNIRKFPSDHNRRPKETGVKSQKQNLERDTGSLTLPKEKEDELKKLRCSIIFKSFFIVIFATALLVFSACTNKFFGFLSVFGDSILVLFAELIAVLNGGITIYNAVAKRREEAYKTGNVLCYMIILSLLISAFKLGAIESDNDTKSEVIEEIVPIMSSESVEVLRPNIEYLKEQYSRDDDIFVVYLERYCGVEKGTIAEESEAEERADIIIKDIEICKKDREGNKKPQLFFENWRFADYEFQVYESQKEVLNKMLNQDETLIENKYFINETRGLRIEELETAKKYRKLADEQYEDAENQKLLAQYCIGLCDEYLREYDYNSSQESFDLALANLLEGAEWAVKSIYNAIVEDNKDKMLKGMKELENVITRLENMSNKIGEDTISMVKDGRDAYRVLIERQ